MRMVHMWMGKLITDLSKEELIEVIDFLAVELSSEKKDKERWMKAADPLKYLMQSKSNAEA